MFCPSCGQQQSTANIRFCSRCGFQLAAVTDLLTHGGLPVAPMPAPVETLSPRQKGTRQGVAMLLTSIVLTPLLGFFADEIGGIVGVTLFMGGIARIIYSVTFLSKHIGPQLVSGPAQYHTPQPHLPPAHMSPSMMPGAYTPPAALPAPPQNPWNTAPTPRYNTGEIVEPPSVTEHTTRHLKGPQSQ